jgi:hypothetical protein
MSSGLFFISRSLGTLAIAYSLVVVCMSRIYLGYHYPTDIIAGMIIGMIFGYISSLPKARRAVAYYPMLLMRRHRPAFYGCFFITFVEFTNIFEDVRNIIIYINRLNFYFKAFYKKIVNLCRLPPPEKGNRRRNAIAVPPNDDCQLADSRMQGAVAEEQILCQCSCNSIRLTKTSASLSPGQLFRTEIVDRNRCEPGFVGGADQAGFQFGDEPFGQSFGGGL